MVFFAKSNFSSLVLKFFGKKKQKSSIVGKMKKYDAEKVLFREKMISSLQKPFFCKNEMAQKMPDVAGRLVEKWFLKLRKSPYEMEIMAFLDYQFFYERTKLQKKLSEKFLR